MTTKERITQALEYGKTISKWAKNGDSTEFKEYNSLSILLTGERLVPGCGNCANDFYNYLFSANSSKRLDEKLEQIQNGKFKIKPGGMIHSFDIHEVITKDNLTDAKALQLLKINKRYISHFSEFPENWQELISEKSPELEPIEKFVKNKKGKK